MKKKRSKALAGKRPALPGAADVGQQRGAIFDAFPGPALLINHQGAIIDINKAAVKSYDVTRRQAIGRSIYSLLPKESVGVRRRQISAALKSGRAVNHEEQRGERWMDNHVAPLVSPGGPAARLLVFDLDITARKTVESRLLWCEERFQDVYGKSPIGMELYDAAGLLVDVNQACLDIFGVADVAEVKRFKLFADHNLPANVVGQLRAGKTAEYKADFDFDVVRERKLYRTSKSGKVNLHVIITPLRSEGGKGERSGYLVMVQDVSRERRAEEELKFRNVLLTTQQEHAIDGILVVDENGKIISYNKRFVEMWGIPQEVIASGSDQRALRAVLHKLTLPDEFLTKVMYLYEHRRETSRDEIFLKEGRVFDRYSAPMWGAAGRYYGRVWYFRDISERKRAEEEMRRANEKLRELDKLKANFTAMVSHELRTPLTAIKGYVALLAAEAVGELSPKQQEYLQVVSRNAERQLKLVNDILDVSKISASLFSVNKKLDDIVAITDKVLDDLTPALRQQGIIVVREYAADNIVVPLDEYRIAQVITNLIGNSMKFSPRGTSLTIAISKDGARPRGKKVTRRRSVLFSVTDQGEGIAAEDLPKIFDPFFQAPSEYSVNNRGVGLGMPIAKSIVEAHGGAIWVESEGKGHGASFKFTLPC